MPLKMCGTTSQVNSETSREICKSWDGVLPKDDGFFPSVKDTKETADWVWSKKMADKKAGKVHKAACPETN